jgi:hypothetical protein
MGTGSGHRSWLLSFGWTPGLLQEGISMKECLIQCMAVCVLLLSSFELADLVLPTQWRSYFHLSSPCSSTSLSLTVCSAKRVHDNTYANQFMKSIMKHKNMVEPPLPFSRYFMDENVLAGYCRSVVWMGRPSSACTFLPPATPHAIHTIGGRPLHGV